MKPSKFIPKIVLDDSPGAVIIVSPRLVEKLKASQNNKGPVAEREGDGTKPRSES
jgi:hypothetical protein